MRAWLPLALVAVGLPGSAWAFTFESVASQGCHERITLRALERAGWPNPAPEATRDDAVLAANLPFRVGAASDRRTLSLLIGVRDNDLHGHSLSELPELAGLHNGEHTQDEHCLRSLDDEGEEGDARALEACRHFIAAEVARALEDQDLDATVEVPVSLRFAPARVPLSRYAFHMGRALHALQDSFAHSVRTDDGHKVRTVMNYIAPALLPHYSPSRDGLRHLSANDGCDESQPRTQARVAAAVDASAALLAAAAREHATPGGPEVSVAVDAWVGYAPGCSEANNWCEYEEPPGEGCQSAAGLGWAPLCALWALGWRRRAR